MDLSILNLSGGTTGECYDSNGQGSEIEYHANDHVEPLVQFFDRQDHDYNKTYLVEIKLKVV